MWRPLFGAPNCAFFCDKSNLQQTFSWVFGSKILEPFRRIQSRRINWMEKSLIFIRTVFATAALVMLMIAPAVRAQTEILTNDEVVAMLKAGLSSTVIVNKIRTSKTKFNL